MKAIFDIGHPAHVHLFRNTILNLQKLGWQIKIIARPKEITLDLLRAYGFDYEMLPHYDGLMNKTIGLLRIELGYWKIARAFHPDVIISMSSVYSAHVSRLIGKPNIAFGDTPASKGTLFNFVQHVLFAPFANIICTPDVFPYRFSTSRHVTYNGYHELAYLHPKHFKPDPFILKEVGLTEKDSFIVMRFAAWDAVHDLGQRGFKDIRERIEFVKKMENFARVFVTSEVAIPELKKNELTLPPEKIHSLLAYATLYIGEGATMASEAGVLGVPWIFVYTQRLPYLDDQERNFNLGYTVNDASKALEIAAKIFQIENLKIQWQKKRQKLLKDKIDVCDFITNLIIASSQEN